MQQNVKFFTYFLLYLFKQKYLVITFITNVMKNIKTLPMTPTKRGWPLLLGIYIPWKSLLNNSKNGKDLEFACAGKIVPYYLLQLMKLLLFQKLSYKSIKCLPHIHLTPFYSKSKNLNRRHVAFSWPLARIYRTSVHHFLSLHDNQSILFLFKLIFIVFEV